MSTRNVNKDQLNVTIARSIIEMARDYRGETGMTLAALVTDAVIEYIANHPTGQEKKIAVFRTSVDEEISKLAASISTAKE